MILIDTNLWLYASLEESPHHGQAKLWLENAINGDEPIALPWSVAVAVIRISTQARILLNPLSTVQAIALVEGWLEQPMVQVLDPGPSHWSIMRRLFRDAGTAVNLTNDAHLAALAIEHNCTMASADNDFRRFPGLRFLNPLG